MTLRKKAVTKTGGKHKVHRERAFAERPFAENFVVSLPSFAPKRKVGGDGYARESCE